MGVAMSWSSILESLLQVCVFAAFSFITASEKTYNCTKYSCLNGVCDPNIQTCETSQDCIYLEQEFKAPTPAMSILSQKNDCSAGVCTDLAFSATLGDQHTFRYKQRCCQAELCDKLESRLSLSSSQVNGVQCPACYNDKDMSCDPVPLSCTGAETECADVIGEAASGIPSYLMLYGKGCVTPNACNLNMTILDTVKIHTFCTGGSVPLRPLSPALASLFLLRVLF